MKHTWILSLLLLIATLLAACQPVGGLANMANPASVFCEENGGKLSIVQEPAGEVGKCTFPDGSHCEEWAYMRGECKPGDSLEEPETAIATLQPADRATPETAADGWLVYHSQASYVLHYPPDATIVNNAEPLQSFSILGPLQNGENWPAITISHPADREEYRVPEGADLAQWLTDHNLLDPASDRLPDAQIAGTTAIHIRHARSPQSYAYDLYYFAHGGQLYAINITHTGDQEDWALYEQFLQSFTFE